jgi:hypothetical protein
MCVFAEVLQRVTNKVEKSLVYAQKGVKARISGLLCSKNHLFNLCFLICSNIYIYITPTANCILNRV